MRVIALCASKGGVGKTTLASALAVRAAQDGSRVALLDTDPQRSLARWHELRGVPDNPRIVALDSANEAVGLLLAEGWDYVVIDTPPAFLDHIANAISQADLVLIPCRASALDVEAVADVVGLCKEQGRPFAFVLNAVMPQWKLTSGARKYLEVDGEVLEQCVGFRKAYITAMTAGKSGPEVDRDGKAREEIDALWQAVKVRLGKTQKGRRRG
jgi:chromosome partitioning protein